MSKGCVSLAAVLGSLACSVITGCVAESETTSTKESIDSQDAELKLQSPKLLGPIASGQTQSNFYKTPPAYRAYSFYATGGDVITAYVKSINGDALGWITDASWTSLAANDDATTSTLDAQVTYTVPATVKTQKAYRIVFRNYNLLEATFQVTLTIVSAKAPACNPAAEPGRVYKGTPLTCPNLRYTCGPGTRTFENACGCGCETI